MSPTVFGNFEDDDLCVKVSKAGYAIMVNEGVFIHHYGHRSFAENNIDMGASLKENGEIFEKKWPDVDYHWLMEMKEPLTQYEPNLLQKADEHYLNNDVERACQFYLEILSFNPLSKDALYAMAQYYYEQENYDESFNYLNKMTNIYPENGESYNLAGCIYMLNGQLKEAENCLIKIHSKR